MQIQYKNKQRLNRVLVYAYYVAICLLGLLLVLTSINIFQLNQLLNTQNVQPSNLPVTFILEDVLQVIYFLVDFLILILFMMFLYRSNLNARALSGINLHYTPVQCILGFITPILNIWRPIKIFRELFSCSLSTNSSPINSLARTSNQVSMNNILIKMWAVFWWLYLLWMIPSSLIRVSFSPMLRFNNAGLLLEKQISLIDLIIGLFYTALTMLLVKKLINVQHQSDLDKNINSKM